MLNFYPYWHLVGLGVFAFLSLLLPAGLVLALLPLPQEDGTSLRTAMMRSGLFLAALGVGALVMLIDGLTSFTSLKVKEDGSWHLQNIVRTVGQVPPELDRVYEVTPRRYVFRAGVSQQLTIKTDDGAVYRSTYFAPGMGAPTHAEIHEALEPVEQKNSGEE